MSELLQVEIATRVKAGCYIAELTDTFVFVLRHPGLSQIISIDGYNANRNRKNDLTGTNAFYNGRRCSRMF